MKPSRFFPFFFKFWPAGSALMVSEKNISKRPHDKRRQDRKGYSIAKNDAVNNVNSESFRSNV